MTNYVLTDGAATVVTYPYSLIQLKYDRPSTSFPAAPTIEQFAEFNVFPVNNTAAPAYDALTQVLAEINPTTSDGGVTWSQAWQVTNLSSEDSQAFYNASVARVQAEVKDLQEQLKTYYTEAMIAGYGFSAEMIAYVDAISNPTALPGYPLISSWPILPTNTLDANNPNLPVSVYTRQEVDNALLPITQELSGVDSMDLLATFEQSLT